MNTKNLKAYAPKARSQFIEAIKKRAAQFGIYEGENGEARIEDIQIEGSAAIIEGRAFTRQEGEQRKRLEKKVAERGYHMFIREMAYTWFNRLATIRYMELHGYFDHGFRVLSHPSSVDSLPEILSHASDVADGLKLDKSHIIELQLTGDKEEQLYRELLLGQCHQLANIMPFVFKGLTADSIDDAAELLLPDNLTKTDSILKGLITDIPEEDWNDIEVIGWLYQFYISEHKDAVIGKVVKSEDIPAATQLFTPNWIVKYLVQNSVGRQWLATYPDSELKDKMEYYIEPAEQSEEVIEQLKAITPTSIDPEEIKVLDPACGSGHILVEVYEVLREIYLERGYRLREIPELILTKNIYGLDIDDRAAQLASFALMMKAREDDRRIFQRVEDGEVSLNVFSLQSTEHLDIPKLWKALDLEGNQQTGSTGGLFDETDDFVQPTGIYRKYFELLQLLKSSFLQTKTLGSLIQIEPQHLATLLDLKTELESKSQSSDPSGKQAALELLPVVNQALCLAQKYDSVVANPPYMGSNGMNTTIKDYTKVCYPDSKMDLFAVYIERCLEFAKDQGELGLVTPYVWMFIGTYEKLRRRILEKHTITSLVQLEYNAFAPACIPVCTFTLNKAHVDKHTSSFVRLSDFTGHENQAPRTLEAIKDKSCGWFFESKPESYFHIPGSPVAYWIKDNIIELFEGRKLKDISNTNYGIITGDNNLFIRHWWEVNYGDICDSNSYEKQWVKYNKGGPFNRWFGNSIFVVNWKNKGQDFVNVPKGSQLPTYQSISTNSLTWSDITSGGISVRLLEQGVLTDSVSPSAQFKTEEELKVVLGFLNTNLAEILSKVINPTLHFKLGDFQKYFVPPQFLFENITFKQNIEDLVSASIEDWNRKTVSWGFKTLDLINSGSTSKIEKCYSALVDRYRLIIDSAVKKESENNLVINNGLGIEGIVSSEVKIKDISLSINPEYIVGSESSFSVLKSVHIAELIFYSVSCMMGRYSLNREGLVYAHSGNEGFKELAVEGAYNTFPADDDGIIPLASEDWLFDDDASTRFKEFVKTVWGDENLQENLEFVAESLCLHALKPVKGESANDTVRRYFSKQFFKDHCKTYKKRPIYWLFSSGKEKAFECLVYLHRYNEGTLSRMRTEYVTPLMGKFDAQHTLLSEQQIQATGTEARRIEKELKTLDKKQAELRTFDEQLKHYAEKRITLDLDDGVKANYGKFGNLLADVKAIHGKAVT